MAIPVAVSSSPAESELNVRTRPFHGVLLHQEAVAEAVDHNEEEGSHADHVAAAEAAGGEKGLLPLQN